MQVCGGDWASHNSATGGYYKCNRFKAAAEAEAASQGAGSGGVRAFLNSVFGRIQVSDTPYFRTSTNPSTPSQICLLHESARILLLLHASFFSWAWQSIELAMGS